MMLLLLIELVIVGLSQCISSIRHENEAIKLITPKVKVL